MIYASRTPTLQRRPQHMARALLGQATEGFPQEERVLTAHVIDLAHLARDVGVEIIVREQLKVARGGDPSLQNNAKTFVEDTVPIFTTFANRFEALSRAGGVSPTLRNATQEMVDRNRQELLTVRLLPDIAAQRLFTLTMPPNQLLREDEIAAGTRPPDKPDDPGTVLPPPDQRLPEGQPTPFVSFAKSLGVFMIPVGIALGITLWRRK